MSENRVIVKNSFVLYFKLIIVSIIGLFSSRFILQALGISDFGLYSVVGSIVFMMAFLNNIMITTTYRFIAFELGIGDNIGVNKVFNVSLVIHILLAIIVLVCAETMGVYYIKNFLKVDVNKISDALFVFRLSIVSTIVSILSVPYQGVLVAKEKFVISSFIEIVRSLLSLGSVVLILFYTGNKLRLYSILICLVSIIPPVLFYWYTRKLYLDIITWNFQSDKKKYREMAGFSGWTMLGAAAYASEVQFSIVLINMFFGTIVNASYTIACQVNSVVKMFAQSLNQTVIPQITKSYSGGNTERTIDLVMFTSKYSFFLILFPSLPILLETNFILKLWLGKVPLYTTLFVQLFVLNALITTMNAGIPAIIQATGKIKYFQIILSSLAIIGLPISYLLFRLGFEPYILSVVYLVITILDFIVLQFLLKWIIDFNILDFFKKVYLKMFSVSIAVLPLFFLKLVFESNFIRFFTLTFLSFFWLVISIYLFGMSKVEKKLVLSFGQKFFNDCKQKLSAINFLRNN